MTSAPIIAKCLLDEAEPWERDHYREWKERVARKRGAVQQLHSISNTPEQARDYFTNPDRFKFSKMREFTIPKVTAPSAPPTKPPETATVIKGRKKWQPAHFAMPKPWKNWR